jgi:low-affinity ferrous iron transport protein
MVFDAFFLMRQQLNSHESLIFVTACLRSRITSNKRMLKWLIESGKYEFVMPTEFEELEQTEFAAKLPSENWFGRISTTVSDFIGHIATVCAFWVCIFIWIGFGPITPVGQIRGNCTLTRPRRPGWCLFCPFWQIFVNATKTT